MKCGQRANVLCSVPSCLCVKALVSYPLEAVAAVERMRLQTVMMARARSSAQIVLLT